MNRWYRQTRFLIRLLYQNFIELVFNNSYRARFIYTKYYKKSIIDNKIILLEATHGESIHGNIFYLLKELINDKDYYIYLGVTRKHRRSIKKFLNQKGITNLTLVEVHSPLYCRILCTAKYLINDTSFPTYFIKKENQIYLNTWHGTPLKKMGREAQYDFYLIGNVQRNFLMADYLLFPNDFTMGMFIRDYMLANIFKNNIILTGYPRNDIFFDNEARTNLRAKLHLTNKQVIAYLPTYRSMGINDKHKLNKTLYRYFKRIDKMLKEDQVLYVNLHPFMKASIDFSAFDKIKEFPSHYETYEFLNITDYLITDYSSVFFDYAVTRHKIILFTFDKKAYLKNRGLYFDLNNLPFPEVYTVDQLIEEINNDKQYDDTTFIQEFNKYDKKDNAKNILASVILNKDNKLNIFKLESNHKDNVLIFTGNLAKNGITTSLFSLINNIDLDQRNYYFTFYKSNVYHNRQKIKELPDKVKYIPIHGRLNLTFLELFILFLYFKLNISNAYMDRMLDKILGREFNKYFYGIKFSNVIHFTGYDARAIQMLARADANRIIFVHADMMQELVFKINQHPNTLKYAYNHYDEIAIVSIDILNSTLKLAKDYRKVIVVSNIHDYKTIRQKAQLELVFDRDTTSNISLSKLKKILADHNSKKIITIGRFSPEKGHKRLIDAFNKVYQDNNNLYLIIIGGYGVLYKETLEYALKSSAKDHIILIKSISNPFPILKRCDLFVLSSYYEGLGLVLLEADTLGVPVISTRVVGPTKFMEKHHGYLVDNSTTGIYEGIGAYLAGKVKPMNIDFEEYNKRAIDQFENLLK